MSKRFLLPKTIRVPRGEVLPTLDSNSVSPSLHASRSILPTASSLGSSSTHPEIGEHVSALHVLRPELDLAVGLVFVAVLQVGEAHLEHATLETVGRNLRERR